MPSLIVVSVDTRYGDAAYAVERAVACAKGGDPVGVAEHVRRAATLVTRVPYPGLVPETRRFGTEAVTEARAGEFARSRDYLTLLRHVVEDMSALSATASP
jgi:hypothetical protein